MSGANVHLWLRYTLSTGELLYATDLKPEAIVNLLETFLESQIGAGGDATPPVEGDVYNIQIRMDLEDDTFYVSHDCGNLGLRDGILMQALGKFNDKTAKEVPAQDLAPAVQKETKTDG